MAASGDSLDDLSRLGKTKITPIEKTGDWGLYVWKLPNGKILGDNKGNILNVEGRVYDFKAMAVIQDAAKQLGYEEGTAVFKAHVRRVSDDENAEQIARMKEGKIPSITDQGAWWDAKQSAKRWGKEVNE